MDPTNGNFKYPGFGGFGNPPAANPRVKIINDLYMSVFGRKPDGVSLNFYINQKDFDENVVRKQMIESTEHKNLIANREKVEELNQKVDELNGELKNINNIITDKNVEIEELNKLLNIKSGEISKIREELKGVIQNQKTEINELNEINAKSASLVDKIKGLIKNLLGKS